MVKGDISPNKYDDGELVLVVDWDLLFDVQRVFRFGIPFFKRVYRFNDYNRKILRLVEKLDKEFHRIIICIPKGDYEFEENVINHVLQLPFQVLSFPSETDYQTWLNMFEPASHLATYKRRYYNKNISKYVAPSDM